MRRAPSSTSLFVSALLLAPACGGSGDQQPPEDAASAGSIPSTSTADQRGALFDDIFAKTVARESFSPVKNQRLAYDPVAEMRALRDELVAAETDEALFYALSRLSTARRDRHLEVALVPGGLELEQDDGVPVVGMPETPAPLVAPIRLAPDYGKDDPAAFFVTDFASDIGSVTPDVRPEVGDVLLAVNGRSAAEWVEATAPYMRHSTVAGLRWKLAELLPERRFIIPPEHYEDRLTLQLAKRDGTSYEVGLPYVSANKVDWMGYGDPHYPGFDLVFESPTFDLYRAAGHPVLLLAWVGFREHMVEDVDRLMDWAVSEGILDYDLVFDATRSGGGSRGPYAITRFSPKPFKITFGNLRISDVVPLFIEQKREESRTRAVLDNGVSETDDDGTWLMEWLETDVVRAVEEGHEYSNDVPFKNAHAPKDSDGTLHPAPVHFTGDLVVLLGPSGGSHLDQFASIVANNDLGTIIGMPAGGYSNTWEWEETLTWPGTDRPVVHYMWSIGHTIRPDGEVLEGNPVDVDEWIPLTPDTSKDYYGQLVRRALEVLGY